MRFWWGKPTPTVEFLSLFADYSIATPVLSANKYVPAWLRKQAEAKFKRCPGMYDFYRSGYLVVAHTDIVIKANKEGVIVATPHTHGVNLQRPDHFDPSLVDGVAPIDDTVKQVAMKIPLPWSAKAKAGYSLQLLPAVFHSPFLDQLYVYSGVIDADSFHTMNFVFSPMTACEIEIPAGTPLLQVIPFKREKITAECRRATPYE